MKQWKEKMQTSHWDYTSTGYKSVPQSERGVSDEGVSELDDLARSQSLRL